MVFGVGIDLIEVSRIEKAVSDNEAFLHKVFSAKEIFKSEETNNKYQSLAARFAGKEAFMKALGTGWAKGLKWSEIEILNNELGKPELLLSGKTKELTTSLRISAMSISLTHLKDIAGAVVVLESSS